MISGIHWRLEACLLGVRLQVYLQCAVQTSLVQAEGKSAEGAASSDVVSISFSLGLNDRLSEQTESLSVSEEFEEILQENCPVRLVHSRTKCHFFYEHAS